MFATETSAPERAADVIIAETCQVFQPLRHSRQDVLTQGTRDQIDAHNNAWDELCL